jgi:hypothetical protein
LLQVVIIAAISKDYGEPTAAPEDEEEEPDEEKAGEEKMDE